MAKLLSNLRTGVRVYMDEAQQADFLDTEVDRSINYAYHDVVTNVIEVYEDFYNTVSPIQLSTVVNQQEYAIGNAGLIKTRRVEINYNPSDPNSTATRATAIKTDEMPLRINSTGVGSSGFSSAGYYINGQIASQVIGFTPVPQVAGTNNISIWGIVVPSDLVLVTDPLTIPYPDQYGYLVELRAAGLLLRKGQQAENYAGRYMEEYKQGVMDMKNFLKDRQSDGVWLIGDALYEDTTFDSSF